MGTGTICLIVILCSYMSFPCTALPPAALGDVIVNAATSLNSMKVSLQLFFNIFFTTFIPFGVTRVTSNSVHFYLSCPY